MAPVPRTLLLVVFYVVILVGAAGLAYGLLRRGAEDEGGSGAGGDGEERGTGVEEPAPTPREVPVAPVSGTPAPPGWVVNGTGPTVSCVEEGNCSVRMAPACCGVRHVATRALDWTLDGSGPVNLTFRFRGSATRGDTDAELRLQTERQDVVLSFTRPTPSGGNNGVTLDGGEPNESLCGTWPRAGEWYDVRFSLEPSHRFARADVLDASGAGVAHCAMHYEGDRLLALRVDGVDYGSRLVFDFDALRIER